MAPRLAVEVIYREFCLAELSGLEPDPKLFLARFPEYRQRLDRLFAVHRHFSTSQLQHWVEPERDADSFPQPGDDIGPYVLFRELGRGGFARVYLAGQADLENRLVVVKLSTRSTREPWLLARVRHAHIVEILSHAVVDDGAFQLICMPFMGGATLSAVLVHRRQVPVHRPSPASCCGFSISSPLPNTVAPAQNGRHARSSALFPTPRPSPGSRPDWLMRWIMRSAAGWPTAM